MGNAQINFSDEFSYTVSDPYKVVDGWKYYFSNDDEVYSIKYGRGNFTFQKFGGDEMNEVKRNEVEKGKDGFTFEHITEFNHRYYFFFSRWDRGNETEQLFVREMDFDACDFIGEERLIVSHKGKISGGFNAGSLFGFGGATTDKFKFDQSFDGKRLIVQYRERPEDKRDAYNYDKIGMHVFDGDLESVWEEVIEMPYTEKKMNNLAYTIDGSGNTYVLAEVYNDDTQKRKTRDGDPNYRLELIKVDGSSQEVSTSKIVVGDKFVTDVGFFEDAQSNIVIAGYYGNTFGAGTDGVFMARISAGGELDDVVTYEVPTEVIKKYMSSWAQKRMDKKEDRGNDISMPNMVLREIHFAEDGSMVIYGERYYVVSHYNSKTGQTTYTYYYQEILASAITADGEIAWMNKYPKNQIGGAGRGGMGYYVMDAGDYQYILFLDNVKNIELPIDQYPKAHKDGRGGYLTGFKVNMENGEAEKLSILNTLDAKGVALYQFNTGRITPLSDNEFTIECYKKKKEDVMVKVTLED